MNRDLYFRVAWGLLALSCWFAASAYGYWTGKVEGIQSALSKLESRVAEFSAASSQDRQGIHQELERCCYKK